MDLGLRTLITRVVKSCSKTLRLQAEICYSFTCVLEILLVSPHLMLATTCYYVCNLLPKQLRGTVETQFFSEPCSRP